MEARGLESIRAELRERMVDMFAQGEPVGDAARLLADLEDERERRAKADSGFAARLATLGREPQVEATFGSILDRPLPQGLDDRAGVPRSIRLPVAGELDRGVVVAYTNTNPTFYRAVIERLAPGEKFRLESDHGTFEMTREEFEHAAPSMVRTASYQRGTDGAPGAARYVTSRVPKAMEAFRVR